MKKSLFAIAMLVGTCFGISARVTVNVSTTGNDAQADGSAAKPYYSLQRAIDKALTVSGTDTVCVEVTPGVYRVQKTIVVTKSPKVPIVVRCSSSEPAVLSGAVTIDGWSRGEGGLWTATVDAAKSYGFRFEQLYVNGERAIRARTPDKEWFMVEGSKETVHYNGTGRAPQYATQQINVGKDALASIASLPFEQRQNVMAMFYHKWDNTRRYLNEIVPDSGFIFLNGPGMKPWNQITRGSRFVLENYKEAITMPGEWWFDEKTATLYYLPRQGEDMTRAQVLAPAVGTLLNIQGTNGAKVKNITFSNISFEHSAYLMPKWGNEPEQAAASNPATVHLDFAENVNFVNCSVMHTGNYGFWFRKACTDCSVKHSLLSDLGSGGVKIGDIIVPDDSTLVTRGVVIENNIIQRTGMVLPCGVGICIFHSSYNKLLHNEISNLRYSGVSVGWIWGYTPSYAHHNEVAYNHIHHVGWGELSDMGAVYTLGISPGTRVHHNHIHDVYSYDYGGWGLYTDEGSTGVSMDHNVVYACKSGAFHQHYGKDNIISNNILAFGQYQTLQFTRVEAHRSFTFCNNIVLADCGKIMSGAWDKAKIDYHHNLYWDLRTRQPELLGSTFAEWSKAHEKHSILADPNFRDAPHADFTFKNLKAAKKIGYEPWDYTQAGVYGSQEWRDKALMSQDDIARFREIIISRE
ncbi:MAG: right-handed parallel beta-helix repeat-containing protein [Muribaculaceae bacterium]